MAATNGKRGSDDGHKLTERFADPDLVDRIFEYIVSEFPEIAGDRIAELKKSVRGEVSGQELYIPQRSPTEKQRQLADILRLFNGRNATEVARRVGCSRATVYRTIKQSGRADK